MLPGGWAFCIWLVLSGCQSREMLFTQHQLQMGSNMLNLSPAVFAAHSQRNKTECFASSRPHTQQRCCQSPRNFILDLVLLLIWMDFYNMSDKTEDFFPPISTNYSLCCITNIPLGNQCSRNSTVTLHASLRKNTHTHGRFMITMQIWPCCGHAECLFATSQHPSGTSAFKEIGV